MKRLVYILFLFVSISASAQFVNNNRQIINAWNFGCKGDMKSGTDGSYTGTTTFTSASAGFVASDVGKSIRIQLASGDLITTIAGFTNSTTVTLTNSTTGTRSSQSWDYGTNNTAGLQASANAVPTTGAVWYLPPGRYWKNGYTNFPNPTIVSGTTRLPIGAYDSAVSNTNTPHSTIYEMAANLPQSINIQSVGSSWEGVDLYCNATPVAITSGVGLNINASDVSLVNSNFGGFWTSCSQNYSAYWKAVHCAFAGVQFGMIVQNLNTADAGDWTIDDCWFGGYPSHPCSSALLALSSGGMKISNSKWNVNMHKCISVEILSSASNTSDFAMINNSLENFDSCGINIITKNSAVFSNITIVGNQIAPYNIHATGINLNGTGATFFKGINVSGNVLFNNIGGDTAIKLIAVQDAYVCNAINGTWTKYVYVDGTSTNVGYTAPNQIAIGTASNVYSGSSDFTSSSKNVFLQDHLQIGNSVNSAGVIPQLQSQVSNSANISDIDVYPSAGTNVETYLNLIPKGSPTAKSALNMFGTDFIASSSNFSLGQIEMNATAWQFTTLHSGSGLQRPIQYTAQNNNDQLAVNTDGSVSVNGPFKVILANAFQIGEGTGGRVGQTTLTSGTKAITITGLTTSSRAFVQLVTPSGVTLTINYQAVCTSNTLTIQANVAAGTINTSDGSTLNYFVIN